MKSYSYNCGRWTPGRALRWEKVRSKGKNHYVFVRGTCFFGGWMFVWMTLFHSFVLPGRFSWTDLIVAFFVWPIAGFIWGIFTWSDSEAGYCSYQSECELKRLEASQRELIKHPAP